MELRTQFLDLYQINENEHQVLVYNYKLCNRINKLLQYYPEYRFQDGDEGIFKFKNNLIDSVKIALKIQG